MLADLWAFLNTVTTGGPGWLCGVFGLGLLGELGLPATCPLLESLLIFSGVQIAHGGGLLDPLPFLAAACAGRICGAIAAYWISRRLGTAIIGKLSKRIRLTRERIDEVVERLGSFALPAIFTARFTPGFNVASSLACGVSRIRFTRYLAAVSLQVLAWEAVFLTFGALGGRISRFLDPEQSLILVFVWIGVALIAGGAMGLYAWRRFRRSP